MNSEGWYPDYIKLQKEREHRFLKIYRDPLLIRGAKAYYATRPAAFIMDWGITYDPRNAGTAKPTMMPFFMFERQKEFVKFLYACMLDQENGAVEKCRDVGATWVAADFSIWAWLFLSGVSIGWGSRKESLVDKLGDPDSIFEKLRMVIKGLPDFLKPEGFVEREHVSYMKIINPENTSTITGESGDNIGRGGRKTIYFKDESAHYERPETIEAALGDNTNVQIDISSVNGPNTVFQRRINSGEIWESDEEFIPTGGKTRVFIFDWRDHPLKTQEWYDKRKARAEEEGLVHIFAQEVDRDASSAIEGTIIPIEWINSAIDAHKKFEDIYKKENVKDGMTSAAMDVADEGRDKHSLAIKKGIVLNTCVEWKTGDVGEATQRALFLAQNKHATEFQYDSIGVGAGVKSETNRLKRTKVLNNNLKITAWSAGSSPLRKNARVIRGDKQSPKNGDFYANLKAQGWWELRKRFEKTHKVITQGKVYPLDELISISSKVKQVHELVKELSQPTYSINGKGKMVVDKNPKGSKSPNRADSTMMVYHPVSRRKLLI